MRLSHGSSICNLRCILAFMFAVPLTFILRSLLLPNEPKIHSKAHYLKQIAHLLNGNDSSSSNKADIVSRRGSSIEWPAFLEYYNNESYPVYTPLLHILEQWNPDDPEPPSSFKETIQHFNYSDPRQRLVAEEFRNAEIPFKIYDIEDVNAVINKWSDRYLADALSHLNAHVEKSDSNHFMYWNMRNGRSRNFKPPTEPIYSMSYTDWLQIAKKADETIVDKNAKHYYFMIGTSAGDRKNAISRDLGLFSTKSNNFFVTNVRANKGIQCRFGMRGIIAEAHYDSGRNMVAMIRGSKRYILTPPSSCKKLGIISDKKHPSYRHSVIDWSDIPQAKASGFANVPAIDTIVRAGEILYIPSYWFHYITSLEYSIQCNSRSGGPPNRQGEADVNQCMHRRSKDKAKE